MESENSKNIFTPPSWGPETPHQAPPPMDAHPLLGYPTPGGARPHPEGVPPPTGGGEMRARAYAPYED